MSGADELRRGNEDRVQLRRLAQRRDEQRQYLRVWPEDRAIVEELEKDNVFVLHVGEYAVASKLTKPGTRVYGFGSAVTSQWLISSDDCLVDGVLFEAGRGADPLVRVRGNAHVTFSNCRFLMSPATLSEGVNIATGCKVHFTNCSFGPDLNGGTGQPIAHAGPVGNVYIQGGLNLTGRAHGTNTTISELM